MGAPRQEEEGWRCGLSWDGLVPAWPHSPASVLYYKHDWHDYEPTLMAASLEWAWHRGNEDIYHRGEKAWHTYIYTYHHPGLAAAEIRES